MIPEVPSNLVFYDSMIIFSLPSAAFMPNLTVSATQHTSPSGYKQPLPQTELFLLKHHLLLLIPSLPPISLCIYSILYLNLQTYIFLN